MLTLFRKTMWGALNKEIPAIGNSPLALHNENTCDLTPLDKLYLYPVICLVVIVGILPNSLLCFMHEPTKLFLNKLGFLCI
jgi:NADH:ubiquinone oxidoreductase subunit 4 (subunit M)